VEYLKGGTYVRCYLVVLHSLWSDYRFSCVEYAPGTRSQKLYSLFIDLDSINSTVMQSKLGGYDEYQI
jgi:hypothetical protein